MVVENALIEEYIEIRVHVTNAISGLAYLEYWIHNGIDISEITAINADLLLISSLVIKYTSRTLIREQIKLGNLTDSSLDPKSLIAKAINQ